MKTDSDKKVFEYKHIVKQNDFDKESNKVNSHYHNHFEIFFFLGDRMTYFIEDRAINLIKYDLVFIPPNTYHKSIYYENTNQERIVVGCSKESLTGLISHNIEREIVKVFSRNLIRSDAIEIKKRVEAKIADIIRLNLSDETELLRAKILIIELLLYIYGASDVFLEDNSREKLNQTDKIIHEIVRHINKNYMQKIALDDLAEKYYISKYYLCHSFKKKLGMSIVNFINMKRLAEAEMLLKKNKKISETALTVGFNSQAFFVNLFKKHYGVTPSEYRKINRMA